MFYWGFILFWRWRDDGLQTTQISLVLFWSQQGCQLTKLLLRSYELCLSVSIFDDPPSKWLRFKVEDVNIYWCVYEIIYWSISVIDGCVYRAAFYSSLSSSFVYKLRCSCSPTLGLYSIYYTITLYNITTILYLFELLPVSFLF